ncbi:hypothetical protein CDD83_3408 [Cordyceps sp. RAO-2017]|nr:hypothetical protein CDD83_3408 [Cordyceps sp. RAO-2017]
MLSHLILTSLLTASLGGASEAQSLAASGECAVSASGCTVSPGDKVVSSFQMYPENGEPDDKRCRICFSAVYNSTVVCWGPADNKTEVLNVSGLSGRPELHASGVRIDSSGDNLYIMINAGDAFVTQGKNIKGENNLVKWNLNEPDQEKAKECVVNLSEFTDGAFGGFQDMAFSKDGKVFIISTFPAGIFIADADCGNVRKWWSGPNTDPTIAGLAGLARYGDNAMVVLDATVPGGQLLRFDDTTAETGTDHKIEIRAAEPGGNTSFGAILEAMSLPAKYGGKVALLSSNQDGTHVCRTSDDWRSADFLGTIPNPLTASEGASTVAAVEAGGRIFRVNEYFNDVNETVPNTLAGPRSDFPLQDITDSIDKLLERPPTPSSCQGS